VFYINSVGTVGSASSACSRSLAFKISLDILDPTWVLPACCRLLFPSLKMHIEISLTGIFCHGKGAECNALIKIFDPMQVSGAEELCFILLTFAFRCCILYKRGCSAPRAPCDSLIVDKGAQFRFSSCPGSPSNAASRNAIIPSLPRGKYRAFPTLKRAYQKTFFSMCLLLL